MKKIFFSTIILGFFFCLPAFASTYYVDATNGSDSNAGTDIAPWRTFSYAATQISASDTLYLQGDFLYGDDYMDTITIPSSLSGTAENHTVISTWPERTANMDVLTMTNVLSIEASFTEIVGLQFVTGGPDGTGATAIEIADGASNVSILGCTFNYADGFSGVSTVGNNSNITLQNVWSLNSIQSPFYFVGVTDGIITENVIINSTGGYYGAINIDSSSDIEVTKNYLHDNEAMALVQINDNSNNVLIANNLMVNNSSDTYGVWNSGASDVEVYHNTFYQNYGGIGDHGDANSNMTAKNNIFANNTKAIFISSTSQLTSDYNLFHNNSAVGYIGSTEYYGLTNWQGGSSQDVDSLDEDPLFTSEENGFEDLRLTKNSLAIDHGTALSKITEDYAGVARPYGPYLDIGAYEYEKDFSPGKVKNVKVDYMTVTWKRIKTASSYIIKLMNSKGKKISFIKKIKTNSYTFTNLKANKKYKIKIKAKRVRNEIIYFGPYSKIKIFRTPNL